MKREMPALFTGIVGQFPQDAGTVGVPSAVLIVKQFCSASFVHHLCRDPSECPLSLCQFWMVNRDEK